eukprot:1774144-Prymnesium_polylepis.2
MASTVPSMPVKASQSTNCAPVPSIASLCCGRHAKSTVQPKEIRRLATGNEGFTWPVALGKMNTACCFGAAASAPSERTPRSMSIRVRAACG